MSVRVQRRFTVAASVSDVWDFISDPTARARAISVVDRFEQRGETTIWYIELPIPLVRKTIRVVTRNEEVDPPEYVRFTGSSKAFTVEGEHTIHESDDGDVSVDNVFVVEGRVPGVETFFRRNLDSELDNLERAMKSAIRNE
ncbi:MAG: SRPBCC family protein [Halodesulfurarchaeum sp.]